MTILLLRTPNHDPQEFLIPDGDIHIGTAPDNTIVLSEQLGITHSHVVLSRSEQYGVYVLINLADETTITRVNRQPVVKLKTLRHRDRIQLGQAELEFWEMTVQRLSTNAPQLKQLCPVCYDEFAPQESVIVCPRCRMPHHQVCWFASNVCARYGCEYPIQESIQRALATHIRFEKLESTSELVTQNQRCTAGNPQDDAPYKENDVVAYCPDCNTNFHRPCFFGLQDCPTCTFDVANLMKSVFDPKPTLHILVMVH